MSQFKVPQDNGNERRDTTISISILDLARFNRIKGFLNFKSSTSLNVSQVTHELIEAWEKQNGVLGDSN